MMNTNIGAEIVKSEFISKGTTKADIRPNELKQYMKIAKELGYSKEVIARLGKAKTEIEASRIMVTARLELLERKR